MSTHTPPDLVAEADAARARVEHATRRIAAMVRELDPVICAPVIEHAQRVLEAVAEAPDVVTQHEILASEMAPLQRALIGVQAKLPRGGNA